MTDNILSSYKGKTCENTVIEYVKDDVDELTNSDLYRAAARVFDKIDHGKVGFLPLSNFVDLIEALG